jgi:hypothetical protein
MKITADLYREKLILPDAVYRISNKIRTVRDGTRNAYEVIRSIPDNLPYDPQRFPMGTWRVTGIDWRKEKGFDLNTYGPVKIRTDAWRWVRVWELDGDGDYLRETEKRVKDTCYWLHYSVSNTTLGCIRLATPGDAVAVANTIARVIGREEVTLEVV